MKSLSVTTGVSKRQFRFAANGVRAHPMLNYTHGRHVFSFVLAFANKPGFSYGVSF
jgi:hypothetical protein